MISEPAQAGGRDLPCGLCRPFHGLDQFSHALTQGSASLHPGLYASACSAGSLKGSTKGILDRTRQNLARKTRSWRFASQSTLSAERNRKPLLSSSSGLEFGDFKRGKARAARP